MSPKDEDGVVCDPWTKYFSFSPGSKLPEGALPGVSVPHLCAEDTLKVFPLKLESQGESESLGCVPGYLGDHGQQWGFHS